MEQVEFFDSVAKNWDNMIEINDRILFIFIK